MQIEIVDRDLWKHKCTTGIKNLKQKRAELDSAYINEWRNNKWKLFNRDSKFPEKVWPWYPSNYSYEDMICMKQLLLLISSKGTGVITVKEDELCMIESWVY